MSDKRNAKIQAFLKSQKILHKAKGYKPIEDADLIKSFGHVPDVMKETDSRPPKEWLDVCILKSGDDANPLHKCIKIWYGDIQKTDISPTAGVSSGSLGPTAKIGTPQVSGVQKATGETYVVHEGAKGIHVEGQAIGESGGEKAEKLEKIAPLIPIAAKLAGSQIARQAGAAAATQAAGAAGARVGGAVGNRMAQKIDPQGESVQNAADGSTGKEEKVLGGALLGGGIGALSGNPLLGAAIGAGAEEVLPKVMGKSVDNKQSRLEEAKELLAQFAALIFDELEEKKSEDKLPFGSGVGKMTPPKIDKDLDQQVMGGMQSMTPVGQVNSLLGGVGSAVGQVGSGVGSAVGGVMPKMEKDLDQQVMSGMQSMTPVGQVNSLLGGVGSAVGQVGRGVGSAVGGVMPKMEKEVPVISDIGRAVGGAVNQVGGGAGGAISSLTGNTSKMKKEVPVISDIGRAVSGAVNQVGSGVGGAVSSLTGNTAKMEKLLGGALLGGGVGALMGNPLMGAAIGAGAEEVLPKVMGKMKKSFSEIKNAETGDIDFEQLGKIALMALREVFDEEKEMTPEKKQKFTILVQPLIDELGKEDEVPEGKEGMIKCDPTMEKCEKEDTMGDAGGMGGSADTSSPIMNSTSMQKAVAEPLGSKVQGKVTAKRGEEKVASDGSRVDVGDLKPSKYDVSN